ncbi:bifunctional serine/threonine-protein kinase/transporter substrate-binding domain-containing protein [Mycolicibacterium sp. F2034L]|uniref:bifunctional serine/threonine-protein kinase/transporter substrate-binding domain-containing protein n=1 Tax=Mycolicibacterium sp. F2034L TaxID=2926422 RepID=UPI001FF143F6|nr:bifunctional serine/threonine-protein kinase/transporter substrate-binding domain-containing protein [Mycolicibacterium sp. F2034L]MCK0175857.1 bifunctional serine/threonine-protein kinase/transporter substrate-binding domain-containing protein [Mycolicibacterium sp. F2034L]
MDATPFGHYQLQKLIGRGGMGEVYQAYDTHTDRVVAVKVLPAHMAQDETFQRRFRRESQAAAGVQDPHVVPIHGYGEIDGRLYLDMRLIEGRNLGSILQQTDRPLLPAFAVKVIEQVATALDAAHAAGLIHRDVKPSNILITDRDFVYLIDFGLARTAGDPAMTTAGSTLGTLAYMAPERFNGGTIDPRSDIYALTCVLYECLTGVRPYPADSLEQQLAGHMVKPIPRPSAKDPKLAAFDEVIAKGMAKKPEKRYQTAAELATAARRALAAPVRLSVRSGRHSARRPKVSARRKISRRVFAVAGAGVVLAVVAASVAWQLNSGPERAPAPRQVVVAEDPATATPVTAAGAVASIAATVPPEIRETGRLLIGVNVPYAPNEFRDAYGEIVGFDVDLMNAVARTLGLTAEFRETAFESVLPSVRDGDFTMGMSSITDTREREELVDFVTYFEAGTLWAQRVGSSIDPADACGLRVGVAYSVIQDTVELPAKSEACVAAGRPPLQKVVFTEQDQVTAALAAGEIDAMSADSPVTGFAIKTSGGALEPAGEVFDSAPYGWPVAKGSGLAESLRQALEHLMATGEYRTIATMWGVEKGMIEKPVINGAVG